MAVSKLGFTNKPFRALALNTKSKDKGKRNDKNKQTTME